MTRGGGVPDDWGAQNVKERSGMAETTTHRFVKKKTSFYGR